MTFLHPLVLLGLAAAAIPALLHLLERRVPPEAEFPPLRYLSEAERQSARRLKLRHLLLLVLRTMLIALIVLAAARPLLPSKRGGGLVHEPTALAVILDNSPSSSVVIDGHSVLDRLKATARASLARATAADRLWLVLADGVARGGTREALLATADSVGVSPYRLDLTAAVGVAARLVDAEPLRAREVHVVSDLQRSALGPGRAAVPRGVRVLALAPLDRAPENRGVGAVLVTETAVVVGVVGTPGVGAAPITVRIQGREIGRGLAAPGSAATIPMPAFGAGWWVGEATLDPDELRADDRRLFVWHVAPPAQVEAQPGAGPFVAAALAVLEEGRKVRRGSDVTIGDRPAAGSNTSVVMPPADAALIGEVNRALAGRGGRWRFGAPGTPGPITGTMAPEGTPVSRRYRLEETRADEGLREGGPRGQGGGRDSMVLARVNGEPWLVRDGSVVLTGSRLDTAWTALPATPGFVPFVDALVNRLVRGEALVTEAEGAPRVDFRTRGADTLGATVLGPDPRESDLTPATRGLVRDVLGGGGGAEVLDDAAFAAARFSGTGRSEVSGLLLTLALLLALVELGVATLTR